MSAEDFRIVQTVIGSLGLLLVLGYVISTFKLFTAAKGQLEELRDANALARQELTARIRPWIVYQGLTPEPVGQTSRWILKLGNTGSNAAESVLINLSRELEGVAGSGSRLIREGPPFELPPGTSEFYLIELDAVEVSAQESDTATLRLVIIVRSSWGNQTETLTRVLRWDIGLPGWRTIESTRRAA